MSGSKGFGWGSKGGGGALATGILQLQGGVPLDTTLRRVADQAGTLSPLQLSTTQVAVVGALGGGLIFKDYDATQGGIWSKNVTPSGVNYALISNGGTTYINGTSLLRSSINDAVQTQLTTTGLFVGGGVSASARLHVRGDGTNPVARFENNTGGNGWYFTSTGSALNADVQARIQGAAIANDSSVVLGSYNALSTTTLTQTITTIQGTIGAAAGSGNKRLLSIEYSINNSGAQTGTATGIFLNATETALNGMLHNLIDLGTTALGSLFSVTNKGAIKVATLANADAPNSSLYFSSDAGRLTWKDAGGTVNNLY